jgi:hypothetical protein
MHWRPQAAGEPQYVDICGESDAARIAAWRSEEVTFGGVFELANGHRERLKP